MANFYYDLIRFNTRTTKGTAMPTNTQRRLKNLRLKEAIEFLNSHNINYEVLSNVHYRIFHPEGLGYIDFWPTTGLWRLSDIPVISYDTSSLEGLKEYLSDMDYY